MNIKQQIHGLSNTRLHFDADNVEHVTTPSQQTMNDQTCMLTAFRHAANSIGVEAGIVASHVHRDEAAASVTGDAYYLELISEAELRLRKLSVRYERLRAAAIPVAADYELATIYIDEASMSTDLLDPLKEALGDDR